MGAPVDFEGSTTAWLAPPDTDIVDLPIHKHPGGVIFCVRFTPAELLEIAVSGCVWVELQTHRAIPVLLSAAPLVNVADSRTGEMRPSKPEPFMPKRPGGRVKDDSGGEA